MTASRSSFAGRDVALLALLACLWGLSFLFIKTAVAVVAPSWVAASRLAVGAVLLLGLVGLRGQRLPGDPGVRRALMVVGTVGVALPWFGQAWAQQYLDSGLLAVLNSCTPAATLAVAVAVGQERLHLLRVVGLAVAVVGTLVVIGGEVGAGRSAAALVVGVSATFAYGFGTVVTRGRVSGRSAPLPSAATQLLFGTLVLVPAALIGSGPPPVGEVGVTEGLALLALGVLGTGLAFLVYFTLIERVGATNASMVTYLVPVVGLVAGAVVRGERFGPNVLVGAAILVAGVWIAQREPARRPAAPTVEAASAGPLRSVHAGAVDVEDAAGHPGVADRGEVDRRSVVGRTGVSDAAFGADPSGRDDVHPHRGELDRQRLAE